MKINTNLYGNLISYPFFSYENDKKKKKLRKNDDFITGK